MKSILPALLVVLLVTASCSGSDSETPGPAPSGVRSVEIQAVDSLRFEPDEVSVDAGETIRFVLVNTGGEDHEFVLGDESLQESHEMDGHEGHGDDALAAVDLSPGSTVEVTVTFDEPGSLLYGCHVQGHYEAGMVGTVTVAA